MIKVKIKIINNHAKIPRYNYANDSGCDLFAIKSFSIKPNEIKLIPTGIMLQIPSGYEAQIRPRSGLAINNGITLLNSPGTIDSGYRGEIKIIMINLGKKVAKIKKGEKIAQLVFNKIEKAKFQLCNDLKKSERGSKGFGSTG